MDTLATWTVLLYLAGHDDLEPQMARALLELEEKGAPPDVTVLVQMARAPFGLLRGLLPHRSPTGIAGDWSGVRRYRLRQRPGGNDTGRYHSELLADLGSVNVADPRTLADFLAFGREAAPADHTALILSGHGMGFPGLIYDLAAGPRPCYMGLRGLSTALRRQPVRPDLLVLDVCSMNYLEVCCELAGRRPSAGWLLTPAGRAPRQGLDYPAFLTELTGPPEPALVARAAEALGLSRRAEVLALRLDPAHWRAVGLAARSAPDAASLVRLAARACIHPAPGRPVRLGLWPEPTKLPDIYQAFYRRLRFARLSGWRWRFPPASDWAQGEGLMEAPALMLRSWAKILRRDLSDVQRDRMLTDLGWLDST